MASGRNSKTSSVKETYNELLDYLRYSGGSDKISIPIRLRERHLTQDARDVLLQAIGTHLQIAIESARDTILLLCPLESWFQTRPYEGRLGGGNGGHLSVGRFEDMLQVIEFPEEDAYGIEATIRVIDGFELP